MKRQKKILVLILFLSLAIRLLWLDVIPGEWFGDISNVHEYVEQIRAGMFPWYFFQSAGPIYHYLITPILALFPFGGYYEYKFASVIVSLIGLAAAYVFMLEFSGSVFVAVLGTSAMSFGHWYLIWSRLGNSQIVIPLFVSFISYLTLRYIRSSKPVYAILTVIASAIGWYIYPHTFIVPFAVLLLFFLYLLSKRTLKKNILLIVDLLILAVLGALPFLAMLRADTSANFTQFGYIGQKLLPIFSMPFVDIVSRFITNVFSMMGMLHVRGDSIFRINVSGHPQLDFVSGVMFLTGLIFMIKAHKNKKLIYIFYMMTMLVLPSISPAVNPAEIPNSGRTIAITPFVYVVVGMGYMYVYAFARQFIKTYLAATLVIVLLTVSFLYNMQLYFVGYKLGLPDQNLAPGKKTAKYIESKNPKGAAFYAADCCWGEYGEPEPKGIAYVLPNAFVYPLINTLVTTCEEITRRPAFVLVHPHADTALKWLKTCSTEGSIHEVRYSDEVIARLVLLP